MYINMLISSNNMNFEFLKHNKYLSTFCIVLLILMTIAGNLILGMVLVGAIYALNYIWQK